MTRVDHINNPNAPEPNSVVPSTTAFIEDGAGRIVLIQRSDNGDWAMPGGAHDFGETISQTAVREAKEETGLDIAITGLIGIYTDPGHLVEYGDGEVRQQFSLCFRAVPTGGGIQTSEESLKVQWFSEKETASLRINSSMRLRIKHGFQGLPQPYIG